MDPIIFWGIPDQRVPVHKTLTNSEGNASAGFIFSILILIGFLMIGLTQKRQGLHDRIAGCLVLLQD
ncbi:MAG: hypothetical protein EHM53_08240 [Methanoregulaceae archaeon]|nr:MAG: hypothetical protein EHM53_08240 [Methanoregulaceae archaeon]